MNNIIKQLETLSEQELYSNIVKVCDLALTIGEQKPDTFTLLMKFQITLYYADALYSIQQFFQAENLYRQALQMRKNILIKKNSNNKITENQNEVASDVDIKYKIHLCCLALKQKKAAGEILQMVSARLRTPKVNMALGNIFKDLGMERSAIACFKEVLRDCPLALEAVENLLKLGIKGVEVNSLMVEVSSEITWLNSWIKAQAQLHSRDFANAIKTYKSMDTHGLLKDNTSLIVNMGYCYHYMCEDQRAISVLQKAFRIDPFLTAGKDLLSTLLAASGTKDHIRTLESLIPTMDMSLWSSEHWVILGNYMFALKKYDKAAYFGQQACVLDRRNIEALLLKANTLVQIKKYQDAASHCTEALQICPYRYFQRARETGKLKKHRGGHAWRPRQRENVQIEDQVLHLIEEDPTRSTREIARQVEVSQTKALQPTDHPRRVQFCEWLLQKHADDEHFTKTILAMDEAQFTRNGINT
ncbi:anaphase-promoting complex subunit 7-like [Anoplophora glabripennis]|uniref:anaphase-promoting complex subunit 7-like n=1 Tax=Anoplophora glabripennis TaxID=217634 RepID=UPI000C77F049|nr:anaphase-promoting complex subunit 7-like [Anoplophora glabripennis]